MENIRRAIFEKVIAERNRQDEKFGKLNASNTLTDWACILTEEVGEVAMAINDIRQGKPCKENLKDELIQSIAVCFAILESEHFKNQD